MKIRFLLLTLILTFHLIGQDTRSFNQSKSRLDQKLMLTLGTWSIANVGIGIYGWTATEDESKYFHQMNVMWSGVNLALAIPGYLKARKSYSNTFTFGEIYNAQTQTEKVFLFNTALDLAYITGGFLFKASASNNPDFYHQFRGYANSLILQGGSLFLFDLSAYILHSKNRKNNLDSLLENINLSFKGNQIGISYRF